MSQHANGEVIETKRCKLSADCSKIYSDTSPDVTRFCSLPSSTLIRGFRLVQLDDVFISKLIESN